MSGIQHSTEGAVVTLHPILTDTSTFNPLMTLVVNEVGREATYQLGQAGLSYALDVGLIRDLKALTITTMMSGDETNFRAHCQYLDIENSQLDNELTTLKGKFEVHHGLITNLNKYEQDLVDLKEKHAIEI